MNARRNASFSRKSLRDLKAIVDNGSLGSECAAYWISKLYGAHYPYVRSEFRSPQK